MNNKIFMAPALGLTDKKFTIFLSFSQLPNCVLQITVCPGK